MSSKRFRSENWQDDEKQLLRQILKDSIHIIEGKKGLTSYANKVRARTWEQIFEKFNRLSYRKRTLCQIRLQWKRMKIMAKKALWVYKQDLKTGAIRPHSPDEEILEIQDLLNLAAEFQNENGYHSNESTLTPSGSTNEEKVIAFLNLSPEQEDSLPDKKIANQIKMEPIEMEPIEMETEIEIQAINEPSDISIFSSPQKKERKTIQNVGTTRDIRTIRDMETVREWKKPAHNMFVNKTQNRAVKLRNFHQYRMVAHLKELKEKEFARRMEMAEEKHAVQMQILRENLRNAQLQRQMMEEKLRRLTNNN